MRKQRKLSLFLSVLVLLLVGQACNLTSIVSPTSIPPTPTDTLPPPATPTPETPPTQAPPAETPDPTALCPTPSGDNSLYVNRENGVCFLYPSSYPLTPVTFRPDESITIVGPREPGESMEPAVVVLGIDYNGPAYGATSAAYAERWFNLFTVGSGMTYDPLPGTIGGHEAVILRNIPAMHTQRAAFVVANDVKYQVTLTPQPEDVAVLAEAATALWNVVTSSLVFFPPENTRVYVRPEEVCPSAGADTAVYRSDAGGYCYLYPASFTPDPSLPGRVEGGPVVLTEASFGEVRTSLTLGTFGFFPDLTPRQLIESRSDVIDTIEDATIGGSPAVTFRTTAGPWASMQAMILVDGSAYTIVAQPYEPVAYPGGMPSFNLVWDTVTASLAFFAPWR